MIRWHRALLSERVLDRQAKEQLFEPRVLEEKGGDAYYAYGWVVAETDDGRVAWHNGGNGWSYGEFARLLDDGAMVFWATNRVKDRDEGWNLEKLGARLTHGIAVRVQG
jgi:hypothetical protein